MKKLILASTLLAALLLPITVIAAPIPATGINKICWDTPTTGTAPTGYKLKFGNTTGGPYGITKDVGLPVGNCSTINTLTLTDGTYFVVATSYNLVGESTNSNEINIQLVTITPNAPVNLRIQ